MHQCFPALQIFTGRGQRGKKRRIRGQLVIHRSCLWIIDFSIQRCNFAFLSLAPLRRDPPALKRYEDVGILARQIAVQYQITVLWRWLTVRHYSTTCSHRTATAAGLTSLWLFVVFIFIVGWLVGCRRRLLFFFSRPPRSPARSPQP